jgi:hypothetical protein
MLALFGSIEQRPGGTREMYGPDRVCCSRQAPEALGRVGRSGADGGRRAAAGSSAATRYGLPMRRGA